MESVLNTTYFFDNSNIFFRCFMADLMLPCDKRDDRFAAIWCSGSDASVWNGRVSGSRTLAFQVHSFASQYNIWLSMDQCTRRFRAVIQGNGDLFIFDSDKNSIEIQTKRKVFVCAANKPKWISVLHRNLVAFCTIYVSFIQIQRRAQFTTVFKICHFFAPIEMFSATYYFFWTSIMNIFLPHLKNSSVDLCV